MVPQAQLLLLKPTRIITIMASIYPVEYVYQAVNDYLIFNDTYYQYRNSYCCYEVLNILDPIVLCWNYIDLMLLLNERPMQYVVSSLLRVDLLLVNINNFNAHIYFRHYFKILKINHQLYLRLPQISNHVIIH